MLPDCVFILDRILVFFTWKPKRVREAVISFVVIHGDLHGWFSFLFIFLFVLSIAFRLGWSVPFVVLILSDEILKIYLKIH